VFEVSSQWSETVKVNNKFLILLLLASCFLLACDPGAPGDSTEVRGTGFAAELSTSEFNALPPEQQYEVANKLLGSMFRGIAVEDYFDTSNGIATLVPKSKNFLGELRTTLNTKLLITDVQAYDTIIDGLDAEGNPVAANAKYIFDGNRPREVPLARIKEYPVSNDQFVHWMAYMLANTIMFSPALEMDAPDISDAQNMYRFLVLNISEERGVREIIRANLPSLARWRVSRSAENHALEAFELYLGLFDTAQDSYNGGIACKDLYLTPENEDYLIRRTDFPNTVPQLILGNYYVTTCDDLYDVVAGHPLLMPRVAEVIVNYLMSGRSQADRQSMIESIVSSGAQTFQDIFKVILFSRQFLLNTERPRSYEENLMPMLDRLKWSPVANQPPVDERIFINMAANSFSRMYLRGMGWDTMSLKIGRLPDVPLDGLSFANYHKSMREDILMKSASYMGGVNAVSGMFYDGIGDPRPFVAGLNLNDFIDYLFLSALNRKATDVEKTDLTAVYTGVGYLLNGEVVIRSGRYDEIASITYDYISRLPEFYYFRAIN
jgi:hypothetical protein